MTNMKRRRESSPFETARVPKEHPAPEKKGAGERGLNCSCNKIARQQLAKCRK
jgi:hypothetical protein